MTDIVEFHVAGTVRIDIAMLVAKGVKAIEVHSLPTMANFSLAALAAADTRSKAEIAAAAYAGLQHHQSRIR